MKHIFKKFTTVSKYKKLILGLSFIAILAITAVFIGGHKSEASSASVTIYAASNVSNPGGSAVSITVDSGEVISLSSIGGNLNTTINGTAGGNDPTHWSGGKACPNSWLTNYTPFTVTNMGSTPVTKNYSLDCISLAGAHIAAIVSVIVNPIVLSTGTELGTTTMTFSGALPNQPANPNMHGYAWSSNIGWVSLNCADTPGNCANGTYGVYMDPVTGDLSGFAWSSNIGWIAFDYSSESCPTTPGNMNCTANVNTSTGEVSGWIKAIGGLDPSDPAFSGWTGWISLEGSSTTGDPYGVQFSSGTGNFTSYAWGSATVGWLEFSANVVPAATIDIKADGLDTGDAVLDGQTANLTWTSSHIVPGSCVGDAADAGTLTNLSANTFNGPRVDISTGLTSDPLTYSGTPTGVKYTITCTRADTGATISDSVIVTITQRATPALTIFANGIPTVTSVGVGTALSLTWTSSAVATTLCTAASSPTTSFSGGGQPTVNTTGTSVTSLTGGALYTFTITCTGAPSSAFPGTPISSSVDVYVIPLPDCTMEKSSCTTAGLQITDSLGNIAFSTASYPSHPNDQQILNTPAGTTLTIKWGGSNVDYPFCVAAGAISGWTWAGTTGGYQPTLTPLALGGRSGPAGIGVMAPNDGDNYSITCRDPLATSHLVTANIKIRVLEPIGPATLDIKANGFNPLLTPVSAGSHVTLTWTSTNVVAGSCHSYASDLTSTWHNQSQSENNSGTLIAPVINTAPLPTTYTIDCIRQDDGTHILDSVTVNTLVIMPTVLHLFADLQHPADLIVSGHTANLTWNSTGVHGCTGSSAGDATWAGAKPNNSPTGGFTTTAVAATRVYTLTCIRNVSSLSITDSVTINVISDPHSVAIFADGHHPSEIIPYGNTANLTWGSLGVHACTASSSSDATWTGSKPNSSPTGGFTTHAITVPNIYSISCVRDDNGLLATDSVSVNPPAADHSVHILANGVHSLAVNYGDTASLTWTSTGMSSCTAYSTPFSSFTGTVAINNSTGVTTDSVTAPTNTYTIICTRSDTGATMTDVATITTEYVPPPCATTRAKPCTAVALQIQSSTGAMTTATADDTSAATATDTQVLTTTASSSLDVVWGGSALVDYANCKATTSPATAGGVVWNWTGTTGGYQPTLAPLALGGRANATPIHIASPVNGSVFSMTCYRQGNPADVVQANINIRVINCDKYPEDPACRAALDGGSIVYNACDGTPKAPANSNFSFDVMSNLTAGSCTVLSVNPPIPGWGPLISSPTVSGFLNIPIPPNLTTGTLNYSFALSCPTSGVPNPVTYLANFDAPSCLGSIDSFTACFDGKSTADLTWTTTHMVSCEIVDSDGNDYAPVPVDYSIALPVPGEAGFTLKCVDAMGNSYSQDITPKDSCPVNAKKPPHFKEN